MDQIRVSVTRISVAYHVEAPGDYELLIYIYNYYNIPLSMSLLWLFRISLCGLILALWVQTVSATEPYAHGDPSDLEQLLLERINETRAKPAATASRLGVTLKDTSARQPLVFQSALVDAAQAHSDFLVTKNRFSHVGAGNTNAQQRMAAAGYPFGGGYEGWAENLGLHETAGYTEEGVLHRTQDLIFKSGEHRQWLLQPFFREIGLGVVIGRSSVKGAKRDVMVITEKFASSGASPSTNSDGSFIQGVVYDDLNGNTRYDLGEGIPGVTVTPSAGSTFHGITSRSGGYAIPMANYHGSVTLAFSGDSLNHSITLTMTGGRSSKADLRKQEVPLPEPAPVIVEVPPIADPLPVPVPVAKLGISLTDRETITLAMPAGTAQAAPMVLLHSLDLQNWSPVDVVLDGSLEVPTSNRQGYYRLAPTP